MFVIFALKHMLRRRPLPNMRKLTRRVMFAILVGRNLRRTSAWSDTKERTQPRSYMRVTCAQKAFLSSIIWLHTNRCTHVYSRCLQCRVQLFKHSQYQGDHLSGKPGNVCSKTFSTSSSLGTHRWTHMDTKPYYYYYYAQAHTTRYTCLVCHKCFAPLSYLKRHMQSHVQWYICETCREEFTTHSSVVDHKRIHPVQRPYACDMCSETFSLFHYLTAHKCAQVIWCVDYVVYNAIFSYLSTHFIDYVKCPCSVLA